MTVRSKLLTAAALVLLSAGCGKKVGGQVVALVNGQEITQQELNAELNGGTLPPAADRKAIMSQILQQVIDRKLMVAKAKADGLDKSPAYLTQVQRAQDSILLTLYAGKVTKSLPLPDASAADTFMAANPSLFGGRKRYQLDQIAFPLSNDPALQQRLRAAKTMAEIESALKASGVQYQSGTGALDTASVPPEVAKQIAALAPAEPFLVPQNGQMVASVIRSAESVLLPAETARPAAVELMRRQAVDAAARKQLQAERAAAKIEYAPGFAPTKTATPTTPR